MKSKTVAPTTEEDLDEGEIPEGWKWVSLGNAVEKVIDYRGRTPPITKQGIPHITTSNIRKGNIDWHTEKFVTPDTYEKYMTRGIPEPGDLIFTMEGPLGEVAVLRENRKFSVAQRLLLLRAKNESLNCDFFAFALMSPNIRAAINMKATGSGVRGVAYKRLKDLQIPLPPLAEQKRIVARVEALLTHINAAHEPLSRVPLIMKKFRQAVLSAACTGKLTEGWREVHERTVDNNKNIKKNLNIDTDLNINFELPDSWIWKNLESVCEIKSGNAFSSKDFRDNGVTAIKISNIGYGDFLWKNQEFLPEDFPEKFPDFLVYPSDLLIALTRPITNDTVKICLYPDDAPIGLLNQRVAKINPTTKYEKNLLLFYLQSNIFKEQILSGIAETLQPNLSPVKMGKFVVPLPPLAEQHEIIRRVGLLFERADAIDREVAAVGRRCERLTQAVLARAFAGKL
jgi:type I restriction enzyme S subunit